MAGVSDPRPIPPPAGWPTRPERPADGAAVREVVRAAFGRPDEADLVDALRADPAWLPGLSLVALDGDPVAAVVGYALLTRCHVGETRALCLAPCAVRPDRQRRGAGSAAIRAALGTAAGRGERFVVVLGHPGYYPRFGFRRAAEHGITLSVEVPADALMVLALHAGDPVPAGPVRYAPPFGI